MENRTSLTEILALKIKHCDKLTAAFEEEVTALKLPEDVKRFAMFLINIEKNRFVNQLKAITPAIELPGIPQMNPEPVPHE